MLYSLLSQLKNMELVVTLTDKQELLRDAFHWHHKEILFGGGARWGKTRGVASIVVATCVAYPWIWRLIGRKERDDLKKTSLLTLQKVLHTMDFEQVDNIQKLKTNAQYHINLQDKMIRFGNGSFCFLVPLKTNPSDPEFNWLWSYEITYGRVDEAQEVDRKAIDIINSRQTEKIVEYWLTGKTILTCNPMKWHLYNDFIKPQREWTIKEDRIFIPSLYTDNPHLDHDKYKASLVNATKIVKERLLYGNRDYDDTPWRLFEYDKILDMKYNQWQKGKRYITCDPARHWQDKAIIRVWDGFVETDKAVFPKCEATDIENKIREFCQRYMIPMSSVIVDEDGMWWPIVDHLHCKGFINNSKALNGENYSSLKDQCYFKLAQYINDWYFSIPNLSDDLIEELDAIVQIDMDKDWPLRIIKKDKIKDIIWRSPDEADSVMMRMWFELNTFEAITFVL